MTRRVPPADAHAASAPFAGAAGSLAFHGVVAGVLALTGVGLFADAPSRPAKTELSVLAPSAPLALAPPPDDPWRLPPEPEFARPETTLEMVTEPIDDDVPTLRFEHVIRPSDTYSPRQDEPSWMGSGPRLSAPTRVRATTPDAAAAPSAIEPPHGSTRGPVAARPLSQPAYPMIAQRRGWEGRVVLLLDVDDAGRVTGARVAESSGRDVLDLAARDHALTWTLDPALVDGRPAHGSLRVPVRFALQ